jgi:hypothetical protein
MAFKQLNYVQPVLMLMSKIPLPLKVSVWCSKQSTTAMAALSNNLTEVFRAFSSVVRQMPG